MNNFRIEVEAAENGYVVQVHDYPRDGKRIEARRRTFVVQSSDELLRRIYDITTQITGGGE